MSEHDSDERAAARSRLRSECAAQVRTFSVEPECGRAAAVFRALVESDYLADFLLDRSTARLPMWSLLAAVQLTAGSGDDGFVDYFHDGHEAATLASGTFTGELEEFVRTHEGQIGHLLATRACQMNEVNRCAAALLPALAHLLAVEPGRSLALIDVGTSAGAQLLFDRFHYEYSDGVRWGATDAPVTLRCRVDAGRLPPLDPVAGSVSRRIGLDLDPPALADPLTRRWIEASAPFESGRTAALIDLVRECEVEVIAGDAIDLLADLVADLPENVLPVVYDSVSVCYFSADARAALRARLSSISRSRDLAWVSLEPFEIEGPQVTTVQGAAVPADVAAQVADGWFLMALECTRFGRETLPARLLAATHPWGLWTRWLTD